MPVEEIDPHRRPRRCPSRTPLNGEVPRSPGGWEGHHVGTWIPTRGRGFSTPYPTLFLPMLRLHVSCQKLELYLLPALHALYPTPLPIPVGSPRYSHPSPVRRLQLCYRLLSCMADHLDCLPNIGLQAHPVEQP